VKQFETYPLCLCFQNADASEIRRAYRRLSLVLHPDKNDAPDAEVKFRQVIYGFFCFQKIRISHI
jgi:preprotein translocase subunit Sec63